MTFKCRERKLNTNFFFLKLFGHLRDIPAKSRDIPLKKFGFPGFEGHTERFGPHPFTWKTPTPPEDIRTQKFGFGFLFLPWKWSLRWRAPWDLCSSELETLVNTALTKMVRYLHAEVRADFPAKTSSSSQLSPEVGTHIGAQVSHHSCIALGMPTALSCTQPQTWFSSQRALRACGRARGCAPGGTICSNTHEGFSSPFMIMQQNRE